MRYPASGTSVVYLFGVYYVCLIVWSSFIIAAVYKAYNSPNTHLLDENLSDSSISMTTISSIAMSDLSSSLSSKSDSTGSNLEKFEIQSHTSLQDSDTYDTFDDMIHILDDTTTRCYVRIGYLEMCFRSIIGAFLSTALYSWCAWFTTFFSSHRSSSTVSYSYSLN